MALTIQICGNCKHEHASQPAMVLDGYVHQILCPCACHTKVKSW